MQFKVPQFLDIEDKIFGNFTFRQFVYLAGGAGLCFVFYKWLGIFWGAIPILAVASFSGLLAFYRPNNKPFINMLESGFKYFMQSKLYVWERAKSKAGEKKSIVSPDTAAIQRASSMRLTGSKLRDLSWSLDVLDLSKEKTSSSPDN